MGLNGSLLEAVNDLGFTTPTAIQISVIPAILESRDDLIALAQTGTGKTASFGLPIVQLTEVQEFDTQSLILCPTRELCMQITKDLQDYAKFTKGVKIVPVYGGASAEPQIKSVKKGAQIIVGTPGRTLDLIKRKVLKVGKIKWLVLDEADEMLNMGFKEDLDAILAGTPDRKQTLLFSATMPKEILRIANTYMHDPREISVDREIVGAENVRHEYYVTQAKYRYDVLKRIADMNPSIYGIVFCRTRRETKEVADKFMNDGYNADALHGDLSQSQRDHVMNRFRNKHLQMLVATDVAARGLDVNDLTHVINYNLPDELDVYVHRSGRTGRAGKSGISIAIVHSRETNKITTLQKITGKSFKRKPIPDGREICKKQLFNLIDKVEKVDMHEDQIEEFLPEILNKLSWLSREELIKHFVSVEFNRFSAYYKNAPDLNIDSDKGPKRNERQKPEGRRSNQKHQFSRFFINLGKKNNLSTARMIGLINDTTHTRDIEIGKIDILKNFSFFEVDKRYEELVLQSFGAGVIYERTKVFVELSKPETGKQKSSPKKAGRPYKKGPGAGKKYGKRKPKR